MGTFIKSGLSYSFHDMNIVCLHSKEWLHCYVLDVSKFIGMA